MNFGIMKDKSLLLLSANRLADPYPVYPIGISYLQSYLSKNLPELNITSVDMNLIDIDGLALLLEREHFDYIGVSLRNIDGANSLDRTSFISGYNEIIDCIKSNSDAVLILGGAGFSIFPEALMSILEPDYGIIGEGEESLRLLLQKLDSGGDVLDIEGIVKKEKNGFVRKEHSEYLRSLELCFDDTLAHYYWEHSGMLNIQTKRGCCYNCIYCSYPLIDGRKVRTLDPDLIVETLVRLEKEKGINYVFFTDSVFNIQNEYNVELAEKIIRSGVKINWGAYFSPHNLTGELLEIFRRSGLKHIEFGTESLSSSQMERYGKNFSFEDVLLNSERCLKHNIFYAHFLILGGLGETHETLKETMENSKKIRFSVFFPYIGMRIYPGTPLQKIAIDKGKIDENDALLEPTYYIEDGFDLEECRKMALDTNKAWVFPDDPLFGQLEYMRSVKKKKGLIWEYLKSLNIG